MIAFPDENANGQWSPFPKASAAVSTNIMFDRLGRSIHAGYKAWEQFRTQNQKFVEAYLGPGYGSTKDKRRKYINKSYQYAIAYQMMLAPHNPRIDVETRYDSLRPFALRMETAINNLLTEIHFEETLRRWVQDAYFQIGIIKVHRRDSGLVEMEPNLWMDPGSPFASNVSLDDFACDVSARNWGEVKWAGDMYRIPFRDIEEGVRIGMYDAECAKELKPSTKYMSLDADRLEKFGKGDETDIDEFEPMIDLADVWIASEQRIYTFALLDKCRFHIKPKPLAVMDWLDPEHSPYHILGFNEAPENVMPVSMASVIDEMDRLINNVMRKQARRAQNQKQGIMYTPSGAATAKRMKNSDDDELIEGRPEDAQPYSTGGVNPLAQQFLGDILNITDELGGPLRTMLGSGAQSDTVGQEQLIQAAGNRMVGNMQIRMATATRGLVKSLAFELWQDDFKTIAAKLPVENAPQLRFDATWKPYELDEMGNPKVGEDGKFVRDRAGNFLDYNFNINEYSTVWQPPAAQLQEFLGFLTNVFVPLMPAMEAQGLAMNFPLIVKRMAKMSDKLWMNELITSVNPPPEDGEKPSAGIDGSRKPATTTHNYNRHSSSNGVEKQQRAATWSALASQSAPGGTVGMGGGY